MQKFLHADGINPHGGYVNPLQSQDSSESVLDEAGSQQQIHPGRFVLFGHDQVAPYAGAWIETAA